MSPRFPVTPQVTHPFDRLATFATVDKRAVNSRHLACEGGPLGTSA